MPIQGQANINVGAENSVAGSDSLFTAFNKIQNNFTTLFTSASNYNTFVGNNGITTESTSSNGTVTITNTGVINVIAGTGITVDHANGNVVVSVSGDANGNLVAGVTNIALATSTLNIIGSPIVSAGIMSIDLPSLPAIVPGEYATPVMTVDEYGRVTQIANSTIAGTVTEVAVSGGNGISVTGGPITSSGTIVVTNTGVTRINPGPGIIVTDNTGELTISAKLSTGTVSQVTISSNTLTVINPTITTSGTIAVELPTNISVVGNVTNFGNLSTNGNIIGNSNVQISGNLRANGNISVIGNLVASSPSNIKIGGGTSSYFLQTDGTGNLSWQPAPGAVGTTTAAAGSNRQVQFNDVGNIAGNASFTFDKTTGYVTATRFVGSGAGLIEVSAVSATSVTGAVQSSITTVGNLTALSVVGNIRSNGNVVALGTISSTGYMYALTPGNAVNNTVVATTQFVNNLLTTKASLADPVFTGIPRAPEPSLSTPFPSTQIATLTYVRDFTQTKADLANPTFTGIPKAPTANANANITTLGTQIATLGYVDSKINLGLTDANLLGTPIAPLANANIISPFANTSAQVITVDFYNRSLYRYTATARLGSSVAVPSRNLASPLKFIDTALYESPPGSIWNNSSKVIQPTVPGYYRIRCQLQIGLNAATVVNTGSVLSIYKNNLESFTSSQAVIPGLTSMNQVLVIDDIVPFNGGTDFADLRWATTGCTNLVNCTFLNGSSYTWVNVTFIRPLS